MFYPLVTLGLFERWDLKKNRKGKSELDLFVKAAKEPSSMIKLLSLNEKELFIRPQTQIISPPYEFSKYLHTLPNHICPPSLQCRRSAFSFPSLMFERTAKWPMSRHWLGYLYPVTQFRSYGNGPIERSSPVSSATGPLPFPTAPVPSDTDSVGRAGKSN